MNSMDISPLPSPNKYYRSSFDEDAVSPKNLTHKSKNLNLNSDNYGSSYSSILALSSSSQSLSNTKIPLSTSLSLQPVPLEVGTQYQNELRNTSKKNISHIKKRINDAELILNLRPDIPLENYYFFNDEKDVINGLELTREERLGPKFQKYLKYVKTDSFYNESAANFSKSENFIRKKFDMGLNNLIADNPYYITPMLTSEETIQKPPDYDEIRQKHELKKMLDLHSKYNQDNNEKQNKVLRMKNVLKKEKEKEKIKLLASSNITQNNLPNDLNTLSNSNFSTKPSTSASKRLLPNKVNGGSNLTTPAGSTDERDKERQHQIFQLPKLRPRNFNRNRLLTSSLVSKSNDDSINQSNSSDDESKNRFKALTIDASSETLYFPTELYSVVDDPHISDNEEKIPSNLESNLNSNMKDEINENNNNHKDSDECEENLEDDVDITFDESHFVIRRAMLQTKNLSNMVRDAPSSFGGGGPRLYTDDHLKMISEYHDLMQNPASHQVYLYNNNLAFNSSSNSSSYLINFKQKQALDPLLQKQSHPKQVLKIIPNYQGKGLRYVIRKSQSVNSASSSVPSWIGPQYYNTQEVYNKNVLSSNKQLGGKFHKLSFHKENKKKAKYDDSNVLESTQSLEKKNNSKSNHKVSIMKATPSFVTILKENMLYNKMLKKKKKMLNRSLYYDKNIEDIKEDEDIEYPDYEFDDIEEEDENTYDNSSQNNDTIDSNLFDISQSSTDNSNVKFSGVLADDDTISLITQRDIFDSPRKVINPIVSSRSNPSSTNNPNDKLLNSSFDESNGLLSPLTLLKPKEDNKEIVGRDKVVYYNSNSNPRLLPLNSTNEYCLKILSKTQHKTYWERKLENRKKKIEQENNNNNVTNINILNFSTSLNSSTSITSPLKKKLHNHISNGNHSNIFVDEALLYQPSPQYISVCKESFQKDSKSLIENNLSSNIINSNSNDNLKVKLSSLNSNLNTSRLNTSRLNTSRLNTSRLSSSRNDPLNSSRSDQNEKILSSSASTSSIFNLPAIQNPHIIDELYKSLPYSDSVPLLSSSSSSLPSSSNSSLTEREKKSKCFETSSSVSIGSNESTIFGNNCLFQSNSTTTQPLSTTSTHQSLSSSISLDTDDISKSIRNFYKENNIIFPKKKKIKSTNLYSNTKSKDLFHVDNSESNNKNISFDEEALTSIHHPLSLYGLLLDENNLIDEKEK